MERLNLISGLQIQFDKHKDETWLLSGAFQPQVAHETPLAAWPMQPKAVANKGIKSEIEPEKEEQKEQYENILKIK